MDPRAARGRLRVRGQIFARAPRRGHTKTRLIPALGAEGAARLSAAFVRDGVATVRAAGLEAELWAAEAGDVAGLEALCPGVPVYVQPPGDLGHRMVAALAEGLNRAEGVLLVGSDLPTLPPALLRSAREQLQTLEVLLGPASDGGFYLLGARRPPVALRSGVRWSHAETLRDAEAALVAGGLRIGRTQPWYDVDIPADLRLLRADLALRPQAAPHTREALHTLAARGFDRPDREG